MLRRFVLAGDRVHAGVARSRGVVAHRSKHGQLRVGDPGDCSKELRAPLFLR